MSDGGFFVKKIQQLLCSYSAPYASFGADTPPSLYVVNASVDIIMALSLLSHVREISISIVVHEPVASQHMSIQMGEASPLYLQCKDAQLGCPGRARPPSTLLHPDRFHSFFERTPPSHTLGHAL